MTLRGLESGESRPKIAGEKAVEAVKLRGLRSEKAVEANREYEVRRLLTFVEGVKTYVGYAGYILNFQKTR